VAGSLQYERGHAGEPMTLAILQSYTPNSGDAWKYTLDSINRYFEGILNERQSLADLLKATPNVPLLELADRPPSDVARERIGSYLADAELLGRRTAQMHAALASRDDVAGFTPEPFTPHYQRSIYQHIRTQAVQTTQLLRRRGKGIPEAEQFLAREADVQAHIRRVLEGKIGGQRIRTHGDYHLGQVLYTGNDFVIIDFEGEPSRPLSERRLKRSALRDVAGMLRSFDYAPYAVALGQSQGSVIRPEDQELLEQAGRFWQRWVSAAFLRAYLAESAGAAHLPKSRQELQVLLDAYVLEKALYEIAYELNNRPDWVRIPLRGILELL
jgi:maltose alpha-D-glucosyltransferase/alpha-amylase